MWISTCDTVGGSNKFFRISLGHESLSNYFQTNFTMMHNYHYSLSELENMIPWERDVYIILLAQHIEKENQRLKDMAAQRK